MNFSGSLYQFEAYKVNSEMELIDYDALEKQAMELETVKRQIEGKTIRKVIVVKGKVVNIVAN